MSYAIPDIVFGDVLARIRDHVKPGGTFYINDVFDGPRWIDDKPLQPRINILDGLVAHGQLQKEELGMYRLLERREEATE